MSPKEFFKHAIGGGLVIALGEKVAQNHASENGIVGDDKDRFIGTAVGCVGGGVLGYYVGEKVANHTRIYNAREKMVSTIVGTVGGGMIGYAIGQYITSAREQVGFATSNDDLEDKSKGRPAYG